MDDDVSDALSASPLLAHPYDGGACDVDGDDDDSISIVKLVAFPRPLRLFSVASPPRNLALIPFLLPALEGKRSRYRCLAQLLGRASCA